MNPIQNCIRDTIRSMNHWEGECGNMCAGCYVDILLTLIFNRLKRLAMFQVSDSTKIFLITPKFLRMVKCLNNVSKSSTYMVVLTKASKPQKPIDDDMQIDDDMF